MNTVLEWFSRYGYYAVFFPVLLEPVGIPFPAETILLAGGATAKLGDIDLLLVMLIAFAAAVIGGTCGFGIGHYGGKPLIDWGVGKHLLKQEHIDRVVAFFDRHGGKTLVFVRFVPGVRIPTFWMAGASGMHLRVFTFWNVLGAGLWTTIIVLLGLRLCELGGRDLGVPRPRRRGGGAGGRRDRGRRLRGAAAAASQGVRGATCRFSRGGGSPPSSTACAGPATAASASARAAARGFASASPT